MATTGRESTVTRSSRPAMALFAGDVSSLGVSMNAARSTSLTRRQRNPVTLPAVSTARNMACSSHGMTLPDLLEDDAMTATRDRIEHLVVRIQSDFLDNPALALTLPAAEKRFGIDEVACAGVLSALVEATA